ncbi:MAG: methylenetetrahydromethanopterin dehydrogenase [Methyloprofundus sp.]|nr:methylenetetrahydromethanopterin dehydrogenase [Methyloprofundus sp.]
MTQKMLYILNPGDNISPFDVTMAADSGFNHIIPFPHVQPENVTALVQDAIFARPPKRFNDTGIFIGGRDVHLAADMFRNAKKAMVGPFEVGVFADPNGAYTTSASVLALVQKALHDNHEHGLKGRTVAVFGTGPVGLCTAVLAAKEGATTRLCKLTADDDKNSAMRFCDRYNVSVDWFSALTHKEKVSALQGVDVVICVAKAGIRIIEMVELNTVENLLVVADTNAVPPSGAAGIEMQDLNTPVEYEKGTFKAIGPLAIGNIKSQTEIGLFKHMLTSEKAAFIDFPEAYEFAVSLVKSS